MADNITKQSKCNRYGKDLQRGQIMSRLNTQIICLDCADEKEKEPHYATAKAAEQNAVLRDSYYFHGVGR